MQVPVPPGPCRCLQVLQVPAWTGYLQGAHWYLHDLSCHREQGVPAGACTTLYISFIALGVTDLAATLRVF
jgi:hypothetical protein